MTRPASPPPPSPRWPWIVGAAAAVVLATIVFLALRLPAAPDSVWVRTPASFDPKPWADVRTEPDGERVLADAWFCAPDGTDPPSAERWDESHGVSLECETPPARRAVLLAVGRDRARCRFAEYRASPVRTTIGTWTWVRYVRID